MRVTVSGAMPTNRQKFRVVSLALPTIVLPERQRVGGRFSNVDTP
jgi:hypothetical protein